MKPFDADPINLGNWSPILKVVKRPIVVHAIQLNFPEGFEVTTMEGTLKGKHGDYLIIGVNGEKYPTNRYSTGHIGLEGWNCEKIKISELT